MSIRSVARWLYSASTLLGPRVIRVFKGSGDVLLILDIGIRRPKPTLKIKLDPDRSRGTYFLVFYYVMCKIQ